MDKYTKGPMKPCGCEFIVDWGQPVGIDYCPLHEAVHDMADMLLRFSKNEPVGDIELRNLLKKAGVL